MASLGQGYRIKLTHGLVYSKGFSKYSCSSAISTLEGIENKRRLKTLSIDNALSNKNFLYYLTFPMLQHTSSEVNSYNCYKHLKKYKNKEGNW